MRTLGAYNFLTLNGFYKGPDDDINWHVHGAEEAEYSDQSLQSQSMLLFGHKTYDMMASWWPTPMAMEQLPKVAAGMNRAEKIVFATTPFAPAWENTRCISGDIVEAVRRLKATPGPDMTILGSGSIISLFADHGLIDSYQFMIDPVALPDGTRVFHGITKKLNLQLTGSKTFSSGVVLLSYEAMR